MSKMGLWGAIGFSLALVSLTQIHHSAEGCKILSATSSGPSSILVKWEKYPGATSYLLDIRNAKSPDSTPPVVVPATVDVTERNIQGLKPGIEYLVTLKVFLFYFMGCVTTAVVSTVPDTSQITEGRALTSTSILVRWSTVPSAQSYLLQVFAQANGRTLNFTSSNTSAVVSNLQPFSNYDCYVYSANQAGLGIRSKVKTITTLVQPPVAVTAVQTDQNTARITWQPVANVLMYQVVVRLINDPPSLPSVRNVSGTSFDFRGILPCSNYLISVSSFSMFLLPSEPTNSTFSTNRLTPVSSVSVDYTCYTNTVTVSWSVVLGADSYIASAVDENATEVLCTSQGVSCQISGLRCGQNYVVRVTPASANCRNLVNATSASFQTVPCPPNNLMLSRQCSNDGIVFSWNLTSNTNQYMARAIDSKGEAQYCLTEDNSCYFTSTVCGRLYSFTVYAISGLCRSEISSSVEIRTAPCIPQNLQTSANCSSDSLISTWDHSDGALQYTLEAIGNVRNSSYTCTSMSNSCAMQGVQCGEHLTITITAFDNECASPNMLGLSAETVPCAPFNVSVAGKCGADSINVTWSMTSGALFYVAMARDSNGAILSCNSMTMSCNIYGLKCSTKYKVYVIASNLMCNSTESETVVVESAACPPGNLTATLDCAANEALVSWDGQPQMNSYTATMVDKSQGLLSCSSTTTKCRIPNLKCGQLYTITVTQHDGICLGIPSKPIYMESVPCGPANLRTTVDCASGVAAIAWNASRSAEGYITLISDRQTQLTYNTTLPELSVSTLECGQEYTVSVRSYNRSCKSLPSEINFSEVPCVPTNVVATRNCSQEFVEVTWQVSRGAKNYTASAKDRDGNRLECVSNQTSCRIERIMCSQVYNISVIAVGDTCTSMRSTVVVLPTEPCAPTNLIAAVNCSNNSAKLTWSSSTNAVSYRGKAASKDGHNVTCVTGLNPGCSVEGLYCGKEYTFTVSASDGKCESPDSKPVISTTAPCAVQSVVTTLNCSTNNLTVSWEPRAMPVNYSATAVDTTGAKLVCITEESSCTMRTLQCGQQYTVTVTPTSSTCTGQSSVPQIVNSVPCIPMNIRGAVECVTNTLAASWDAAAGAASYISTVKDAGGFSASCPTTSQSCQFPALQCAQTYSLSVVAVNDRCNSSKSATISATTAPCDPTNVSASLDCLSGEATVTWGASAGATYYTVVAAASGQENYCTSTNTSCKLTKLECGKDYTVTVLAGDAKCNSSVLAKTNLTTAPCAPVIQSHTLNCSSNQALIIWAKDNYAMSVTVNATSSKGRSYTCSSSTNNSCVLDNLLCGYTYTVQAVAQGVKCLSKPSTDFQIVTAPCTPARVEQKYSCDSSIAFLSWDETLGRESFYVLARSGNHTASCSTSQTDCSLSSLLCGSTYNVEVTAVSQQCNSSIPGVTQILTAPCPPMNVSASLVCDNNTALVKWQQSPGALSYNVTAAGRDGDIKECSTNGTSCQLQNMHCAQTYIITVTPFSDRCRGRDSFPYSYIAGPCPPTNVQASLQCLGNVGLVTWTAAQYAELYVASAVPSITNEHAHNCSSNGTSCSIADLHCGETLTVSVYTIERGCRSGPSQPFTFQSVICPPTAVTGVTNCSNNDITVRWQPSPKSGVDYFVYSRKENGTSTNYSTTQTSYVISGLKCGELYNFTVAARNPECTSLPSEQIQTETAPCPPTNLTVRTECATNLATLAWMPSKYAISYTASITDNLGRLLSCRTNTTACSFAVECSRQYSAVVVASGAACNSSTSNTLTFYSAPCLPSNVTAQLDCNANAFTVQWSGSANNTSTYTAIAIGSDMTRITCNTTNTNCVIQNLRCGLTYSIVVTTSSVDCGVIKDSNYKMQSAPCTPDRVSWTLQCKTNVALVTWGNSGPDQTQTVSAVDSRGVTTICNSSSSNCTFNQLSCGKTYAISVVGRTDTCTTQPVAAKQLNTAPCVPTHLTARVDCDNDITVVTWDAALGATLYTVYARGSLGHNADCNNTDTNCNFPDLPCGQDYNITVIARHDTCVSLVSNTIVATTGPCPHSGLKTRLDCNRNAAIVSWTPGSGMLYYNASADAFAVVHQQTCSTSGSSCNISSLRCGESYKVSVSGQGQNCPSPAQDWQRINTAPCAPTNLTVNSSCTSNNISVSWQASQGSVSYMAVAENTKGDRWTCNSTGTTCQISSLLCGQKYMVYVIGYDDNCFGARSDVIIISTAPCVPQNIQNRLDCLAGVLNVTWQSTGYFLNFRASVKGSNGQSSVCITDKQYCVVQNMQCGQTYNVTVLAQDSVCNSSCSPMKQVLTAPCPLSTFRPVVNCGTGVVSVRWNNSVAGVVYAVTAADAKGRTHNCSGTSSGCNLNTLQCGTEYNVTVTPSRDGCVGRDSPRQTVTTVPCVPNLLDVEIDCLINSAWMIYDEAAGAQNYIVVATNNHGFVENFECNSTSDGVCALPPLMCSQNLTFTMMARDQQCSSAPSNAVTKETAPCAPEDVRESADCDNGTIIISWSAVPGAVTYTSTLEMLYGNSNACCTTSDTACNITDLPCSAMYILHVVAEGRTCNSSESLGLVIRTVPCIPEDLEASVSCSNNVASLKWSNNNLGQIFNVKALGTDGHVDKCRSTDNQCDLTQLHCGQHYTATVTAEDAECISKPSESVTFKTVPCTPENVSSVMACNTNSLMVSWSESPGADSYVATLEDSSGLSTTCQAAMEGNCSVTGLGCGQIYHVTVVSSDGYCNSPPSTEVDTPSVPCEPRYIKAVMECQIDTALVEWYLSDGALYYIATAITASGHNVSCQTNSTYCDLEGLRCGQSYSVSVKAVGPTCSSIGRMTGKLVTGPCTPEHVTTLYSFTIGQVQWDMTLGADYYTVRGETDQGLIASCVTNDTYCALYNMVCSQTYNITVTAYNRVCEGHSTAGGVTITTEPCPPNNVQTSVTCHGDQGTVSWEASARAVAYEARLAGRDGHSLSCYTNNTFCDIQGLHCGVIYHTNVIAIGKTLNSSSSTTTLLVSAPCAAEDVAASLDCVNNTAEVSWTPANGANSYLVTAVSPNGYQDSCETDEEECHLTALQCGQVYSVTITSIGDRCQTRTQTNATLSTRPCKPLRVGVDLQCGSSTANMYWDQSDGVKLYVATVTCSTGKTLQCNTTNSTCQFSNLYCGKVYEFSVTAYSDMCSSEISSTVGIQTEPCQPSGLNVTGSCNNSTVVLNWSEAKGALVYVVTASGHLGYVTSFQTSDTKVAADLPCGQLYTFTVLAQDDRCDSAVSLPKKFKTGPCIPEHVQSYTYCENNLGSVSWAMSAEAESYMAFAMGKDGHIHECATNTTTCTWNDLHCGDLYTVHIIAMDYKCSSLPSNSTSIRMAPCIPQNVTSSLNCSTKVGSLVWSASEIAKYYVVTAENNSGHKVQLSTNDTWTFISEFQCGQEYFLSVQAADSVCTSRPSQPSRLMSEPCPPTGVNSFMNCISNIAVVAWTASAGAEFYTATVTQENGQSKSCWSDNEQCSMPNVQCGQNYTVTVVASNKKCDSDPSKATTLQSVPCVPTDVAVKMNCSANQAVVSWSASTGALSYEVLAQSTEGAVSSCHTADVKCTLTNLTCGQSYLVQVVARDDICSSLPSPAITFYSVPCTPSIGSVFLDCFTNSALLDWSYAEGASEYTATAKSSSGNVSTCTSNFTNCELQGLQCGQTYNVTTVASNGQCNSPPSTTLQVESVPCPPSKVVPVLDCVTNTAQVKWQASMGADSYIVQAFGVQEHEISCETRSQSCMLPKLLCGFTYNVSVIAVNSVCNVSQSDVTQLQAVPCVPELVEGWVECESGAVTVSWEPSKGASLYTTVAQGSGGYASTRNSTETTSQFKDLLCGLNYSITVSASDNTCSSAGSSVVKISTVPCVPQKVAAKMMCSNNTGVVSWEEGEGVASYKVQAFGPDGHKAECNSTKNSCQLPNMHCGQLYNLTVTARDGRCDTSHAHLNLQSVPCRPTSVKAALQCQSNSAAVTWEGASGALSYVAVGVAADGSHRAECNNTMTYCNLGNLRCGQTYNVSVFSQDGSCSSLESDRTYVQTAPCPPSNVAASAQCNDRAMVVSWSPNPYVHYSHVAVVSNTGARHYCNSSGTNCTISNLPCGQTYNITTLSVRDGCESKPSPVLETSSAPCVPANARGRLDCVSNSAWVMWDIATGATSYFVLAKAANGHTSNCTSTSSSCNVPDLKCGAIYTFHVTAINKQCRSNCSNTFEIETGPCALRSVNATTYCDSNTILVEWEVTLDTPLYLVTAEADNQDLLSCNSTSNSCILQDVRCGMYYSIIVSASSNKCSSLRSPPKKIKTAPCIPTNVTVVPSCKTNGVSVAWAPSPVATSYQLTATGRDGHVATCYAAVSNCSLAELRCGQPYSLNLTASGDYCTSQPSISSFRTVPCPPSQLAVDYNCESSTAVLSWNASEGAVKYCGRMQSMNDTIYCDSLNASCTFTNLKCGGIYNFSARASDSVCNSSFSAPKQGGAAPCAPTRLRVHMQRIEQTYWAMVSWDKVACPDVEYLMEITGQINNNPENLMMVSSCWLSRPYFELPIPCSTAFNITVRSRNAAGVSKPSSVLTGISAPCAPQNVMYTGNTQSAVLYWNASALATSYTVYNESGGTRTILCTTAQLSCQLTSFNRSSTKVTASNSAGESDPSQNITGPIGARRRRDLWASQVYAALEDLVPEVPQLLSVTVSRGSLYVKWTTVKDATGYTVVIEEEQTGEHTGQPARVRSVEGDSYVETDLKPQTTYCVRVAAKNAINQSNYSWSQCRNTGASK